MEKTFKRRVVATPNGKEVDVFAIMRQHFPEITKMFKFLDSSKLYQVKTYCVPEERIYIRIRGDWEEHLIMDRLTERNMYLTKSFNLKGNKRIFMKFKLDADRAWEIVPRIV